MGDNLELATALAKYDVVWRQPSKDHNGSMPIGNGEIGVNTWVDRHGRLILLISRTDSWDEIGRLCKIGQLIIETNPPLARRFFKAGKFMQRLNLWDGFIEISIDRGVFHLDLRLWVDAHAPIIHVTLKTSQPSQIKCQNHIWRTVVRPITTEEESFPIARKESQMVYPDIVVNSLPAGEIGWQHTNQDSIWPLTLQHQGLGDFIHQSKDPLRQRIFGCLVHCENTIAASPQLLQSTNPQNEFQILMVPYTEEDSTPTDWLTHVQALIHNAVETQGEQPLAEHKRWWNEFWQRSWIFASGTPDAEKVTQGYILQRWVTACGGRGNYAIKFNGSIFTVNTEKKFDPDFRRWGPGYWFQNTRIPYWAMLMAGDFDLFQSLVRMYTNIIPLAEFRSKVYFNHEGWHMPETMAFWGTYTNNNYGDDRSGKKPGDPTDNRYIRYHYNGSLEFLALLLEYNHFTGDKSFFKKTVLPVARGVFLWWDKHWSRDTAGKLFMFPSNSVETYWDCINPTPDITGLLYLLDSFLAFPTQEISTTLRQQWLELRKAIPEIPFGERGGKKVISPAFEPLPRRTNCENPELYSIFPYPIYGLFQPDLALAQDTFRTRIQYNHKGWSQDEIQAALLGLTDVAQDMITKRAGMKHPESRFPAFWGPNFDWVPDQDHGGNLMTALQRMVLQGYHDKIRVMPAWPPTWSVWFKLHMPRQTIVEGRFDKDKIQSLKVSPQEREKDLILNTQ